MALRDESCLPCRDGGGTLSFADFATALRWLNCAGAICEEQGHHGDFRVGWGYVEIDLFTHKADGLTRADAVLAAKLDAVQA